MGCFLSMFKYESKVHSATLFFGNEIDGIVALPSINAIPFWLSIEIAVHCQLFSNEAIEFWSEYKDGS